jgi:UDPglucose 6-dehydrogenase
MTNKTSYNITVTGIGYVGLANALLLAQHNKVVAYDLLQEKIDKVAKRDSPLDDKEIKEYIKKPELNFTATLDKQVAYDNPDFVIVATPTDYDPDKEYFNTRSVESVVHDIAECCPKTAIVIKSTVPVGFTKGLQQKYPGLEIIFSPEFLREGKALYDNLYPSRIIVGSTGERGKIFASLLQQGAIKKDIATLFMQPTEAEAVKLFANTFLALRVAYFNEMDTYAELEGLSAKSIIQGVSLDPRVGDYYNNPSFGYGGYCLPKDTKQLKANYKDIPNNLITAIVEANSTRKEHIANMVLKRQPKTVGIYKLAMKADSDNARSSAIIDVIKLLKTKNVEVLIYDPSIKDTEFEGNRVITDLTEFKQLSSLIIANRMSGEIKDVAEKLYTRDLFARD